ncbi:MAG TPA: asparagine synthase-related protein [Bryobacteraceae bacterium]|nr:asparagine synthase-related protein [Bryobacteraceae bacterium]
MRPWQAAPSEKDWYLDADAGVALFRPEYSDAGGALSMRGVVHRLPAASTPPTDGRPDLLKLLLDRDTQAIREMRGEFAIALWDAHRQRLLLARDHLGQRTMFFLTQSEYILFCSELAPLLHMASGGCRLDRESAFWYLAFGVPAPGKTLTCGIERVPAAHVLILEPDHAPIRQRYWTPLTSDAEREPTPAFIQRTRTAIESAIATSRDSSGPCGVLVSGGVDSTFLASTLAAGGVRTLALTAAFEERHGMNETEYANAVAVWLKAPHRLVTLNAPEALDLLDKVILTAAEPCSAWASLTHFKLMAAAFEEGAGQIYSGLGADEIFGGYDHMRGFYSRLLRWSNAHDAGANGDGLEALLQFENQSARRTLYPGVARFFRDVDLRDALHAPYCEWQYASQLRAFYRECRQIKPDAQPIEMMVAHECQYRIPDLLMANFEAITRRSGVEVVYPFLDPDVVRMATGLSAESRYRTPRGAYSLELKRLMPRFKYAMMRVAEDRVPADILNRPRKSYTAPFGGWFFEREFAEPIRDRLRRSRLWDIGFVRREWLEKILARVLPGPNPWVFQLWALVTLAAWYDRFVEPPKPPG